MAGYGKSPIFDTRFERRLLLEVLSNQMEHLAYFVQKSMAVETATGTESLTATLRKLRKPSAR